MASNKFEEDIKEKLEGRRLKFSENAWSKLSSSLGEQKETKNNKSYWLFGLAASIVGVLLLVSQFFNNQTYIEDLPKVVDSPEVIIQDSNNVIAKEIPKEEKFEENKTVIGLDKNINQINKKATEGLENNTSNNVVAVSSKEEVELVKKDINQSEVLKEKPSFEEQKIQDIVAQVHVLKEAKTEVTDADIDALLLQAQQEIRLHKILNETTGLVDANVLLQEVEEELDQSFREKVFDAIKTSFNSVKTAVAQRND
ncbi:hypothetical protein [Thalassobellus suaedae]|uniref:Uncharacterized protein n=1 Tax=Thalassobellus suaedae TaxID=3074124 RepID=A0ABY9XR99_9FLAO|nr:hypothetical protein RHP51_13895 [Flavobacteriaceae bacterium HL-DH14]